MPSRIQRRRTKGWRMPEGAVYVGRPSRWGNAYRAGTSHLNPLTMRRIVTQAEAVEAFRAEHASWNYDYLMRWLEPLRGRDLVCWSPLCDEHADGLPLGVECPDCAPCHADFLLVRANA